MVWVKNGLTERLSELKLGERGFGVCESDASVGGCDA